MWISLWPLSTQLLKADFKQANSTVLGMLPWIPSECIRDSGEATSFYVSILSLHQALSTKPSSSQCLRSGAKQRRGFLRFWAFILEEGGMCLLAQPWLPLLPCFPWSVVSEGADGGREKHFGDKQCNVVITVPYLYTHPVREVIVPLVFLAVNLI